LPSLRQPRGSGPGDFASLVVFVGPHWDLAKTNPLRGAIPWLHHDPPTREMVLEVARSLAGGADVPDEVADALSGLGLDVAEQAAAECLAANGNQWNIDHLRATRRRMIRDTGLELW